MSYRLVYADPPWKYRDKRRGRGGAEGYYPTLTMGQIAWHIESFANPKQCTLAAWQTWPMEEHQDALFRGLGFRKIGLLFLWEKLTVNGKEHFGGGLAGTRANTEPCFLWRRGPALRRWSASEREIIRDVVREHSAKPPEARARLSRLFRIRDRIELYAREQLNGWDVWGNQVTPFLVRSPGPLPRLNLPRSAATG